MMQRIKPADHRDGRRIGFSFDGGQRRFYDIDADGRVYWLRPAGNNKLTRYRVRDAAFAEWVRGQAEKASRNSSREVREDAGNSSPRVEPGTPTEVAGSNPACGSGADAE